MSEINVSDLKELKRILREDDCPFFSDEDLAYYLEKYKTLEDTAYNCLLIKAEDTTLSVSGLNLGDTSRYFLRLAQRYRKGNSCILKGG